MIEKEIFPLKSEEEEKLLISYWVQNAEDVTRRSEATLRSIFDSSQDGFVMISPLGKIITFNRVANEIFWRLTGNEIHAGEAFSRYVPRQDKLDFLNNFERALAGEITRFEKKNYFHNNNEAWFLNTFYPVLSDEGHVLGVCYNVSDITERKKTEAVALKNQALFQVLIEGLKDYAFYLLDQNGFVTAWNMGAERLLGYQEKEAIGLDAARLYTRFDNDHSLPQFVLIMAAKNKTYEFEGLRVRKDGTEFWAQSVITPLFDMEGELYGFTEIIRDISERKREDHKYQQNRHSTLDDF